MSAAEEGELDPQIQVILFVLPSFPLSFSLSLSFFRTWHRNERKFSDNNK